MGNFVSAFSLVQMDAHAVAVDKGFWAYPRNDGEMLALIHSELSEALEAVRHGRPQDEHCPAFESYVIELADVVIRVMDLAEGRGLPLAEAILAKLAYNATRGHKHGKVF